MTRIKLNTAGPEEFFKSGRRIAALADAGRRIPPEITIAFEDPEDLARLITNAKIDLFKSIKRQPASIKLLATRLARDRRAVKRDIDELASAGLVIVELKTNPGHGRFKEVRAAAESVILQAELA